MIELIVGGKGKGKTKELLRKAGEAVRTSEGTIVYVDKSLQHMYELSNKIRLINITNFPIESADGFIGFVSGIISQDHDLEYLFLDSFTKNAHLEDSDITVTVRKLAALSEQYSVKIIVSVSMDAEKLPEGCREFKTLVL